MNRSNLISLGVLPILVVAGVLCAPQGSQQIKPATIPTSTAASQQQTTSTQPTTSSAPTSTTVSSTTGSASNYLNSAVSQASSAASTDNNDNSEQAGQLEGANNQAFDGRNLFADDSLWQIPIHLVRDLSTAADGNRNDGQSVASKVSLNAAQSATAAADNADDAGADELDLADEPSSYSDKQPLIGSSASSLQSVPRVSSDDEDQSSGSSADLKTAAGYHYPLSSHGSHHGAHYGSGGGDHHYGKYYQYASVPKPYTWESGYRRGNPYHTIERHEKAKGPHYQGKVKWSDKHAGYGVHVYDYNHDDHHSHHHHHHYDEKHEPKYEASHHSASGNHGHKRHAGYHH